MSAVPLCYVLSLCMAAGLTLVGGFLGGAQTRPHGHASARRRDHDGDNGLAAYVKEVVDALPPLTDYERDLIALIFRSHHPDNPARHSGASSGAPPGRRGFRHRRSSMCSKMSASVCCCHSGRSSQPAT